MFKNNSTDKYFIFKFLFFMALIVVSFKLMFPSKPKIQSEALQIEQVQIAPVVDNIPKFEVFKGGDMEKISPENYETNIKKSTNGDLLINELSLKKYSDSTILNDDNSVLFSFDCNNGICPTITGSKTYTDKDVIIREITYQKGNVFYSRAFGFYPDYTVKIIEKISNKSNAEIKITPIIKMQNNDKTKEQAFTYRGAISYINGELKEFKKDKVENSYSANSGWAGFTNRYFQNILLISSPAKVNITKNENEKLITITSEQIVLPNETKQHSYTFFIGPKQSDILSNIEKTYNAERFDLTVDYGTFHIIAKPVGDFLTYIYKYVGNMGIAIIILTILIRILLFPLAQKSFKSTLAMKKLHPQLKTLKTVYKDDKMKLNQETIKLYQKNKISPASGCLPLLLQIPVLFALYRLLLVDFDVRGAGFLYLPDLSLADPTSLFNLFGLLPYTVPSWLPALGLLPILMGITMFAQQKLQGNNEAMAQMPIIKYMPFIFILMFGHLASGLILYWTVSNIFAILQMYFLERRNSNARI